MTILVLKANPVTFDCLIIDRSKLAFEALGYFPNSMDDVYAAELVLYDTACNRFTLATRLYSGETGWRSVEGSLRGRKLCERLGHLE